MTKTEIRLDLTDVTAKGDSELNITQKNQVTNIEDIRQGIGQDYATLEKNTFLLDGNENILPQDNYSNTGYCSSIMSGLDNMFENPIELVIDFDSYHTSAGITIQFGDDAYCDDLLITYLSDGEIVFSNRYYPNNSKAYLEKNVIENYNKIIITFYSMNLPNRYLKILDIEYGFEKIFSEIDIESADSDSSINILSSELPVNTLDFSIIDKESLFNVVNPNGYYKDMQENQKISVYEYLNDRKLFIGNFYLTGWSNPSVAKADFQAHDLIGVLDNYTFKGGIYTNIKASDLIIQIFEQANISDYEFEESLQEIYVTGYVPMCSCRQALQQILFVSGAVCTTSGVDGIKIFKPQKTQVQSFIEDNRKEVDTTEVELNQTITGIDFALSNYVLKEELKEVAKGNELGIITVKFSNPIDPITLVATNCIIIESGNNFATILCENEDGYRLEAYEYQEEQTTILIQRLSKGNIKESVLSVKDIKLINKNNITQIADRIFNHYNSTYKTTLDIGGDEEIVGDFVSVNTFNNFKLLGNITEMSIDLKGGFRKSITIDNAILKQGTVEFPFTGDIYSGYVGIREGV